MEKHSLSLVFSLLLFIPLFHGGTAEAAGTQDGSEEWGYVEVRPSKQFSPKIYVLFCVLAEM